MNNPKPDDIDVWDGIEFEHESEKEWSKFLGRDGWMPEILNAMGELMKEPRKLEGEEKRAYLEFLENQVEGVHSEMSFMDWSSDPQEEYENE